MEISPLRQWVKALAQPATYIGAIMLFGIVLTVMHLSVAERDHALDDAQRESENVARLFGQSMAHAIKGVDHTILLLRSAYQADPARADLSAWAGRHRISDLKFGMSIVGADGSIKTSTYSGAVGLNVSDRSYFRKHVQSGKDELDVSQPVELRTSGDRTIMLSRPIISPSGSFDGMINASFEIKQLQKFYRGIDLGGDGFLLLVGLDGVIRAAGAEGETRLDLIGRDIRGADLFRAMTRGGTNPVWSDWGPSVAEGPSAGVKRLVTSRPIDGLPLIAVVSMSQSAIYAHADNSIAAYTGIAVLLSLAVVVGIGLGAARERKLQIATAEITHKAYRDNLTGVGNRTMFQAELDCAVARLRADREPFSLLVLDLDHFKTVNDTLGHAAGDALIEQVARRLERCMGEGDVVTRLGGDEFAILQRAESEQRDEAIVLATKVLESIGEPYEIDGHRALVETSIGIALAPSAGEAAHSLLKSADLALYKAKSQGRNTFYIFEPGLGAEAAHRYQLEYDLRNAILRDEFEVRYQLIVDARTAQACGVEALTRWRHARRGLISPDVFIPVAESTGLIVPLGEQILRQACADAARWPAHIKVAVNLSPIQFRKGDIVGAVSKALLDFGLAPERLELEITESVLLQHDEPKLHELKSLGVSIALDDFGTGYSSLSYLVSFPFDKIKIDRSFVAGLATRSDCAAIVCAVTGLARSLNAGTVAEGVETMEQFELLRAAGCDQAQGFLFGTPSRVCEINLDGWHWPPRIQAVA